MLRKLSALVAFFILTIFTVSAQTPPNNEIWYTTTDGKTISKSFDTDDLVSHSYNNGRGVLKFRNSVTSIEDCAFYGCSSLKSITIPNSVTRIEDGAFRGCSSLTSITIPNSVPSIGRFAFYDCSSLKSFKGKFVSEDGRCLIKDGELIAYAPAGLTSYTIPNSVTSIGGGAFADCNSLTSITIPNSVTEIGGGAFYDCSSLTNITIPNSVTSIGHFAFDGCSNLTSITIGNSVTSIGWSAFRDCSSLTSITIPNSVTYIEHFAFDGCSSLTSITIPNSVTRIEDGAFRGCSSLTSITIPNSVTSIGEWAFEYCSSLKSFKGKFASEDGRCLIKDGELIAFAPAVLTSYTIPNSVTSIGGGVFRDCSSLTSITIPNSVTSIEEVAFSGCSSLKSVKVSNQYCYDYFKDKVANIAFYGANASDDGRCLIINGELKIFIAEGITEHTIPESVTSFGKEAFEGCSDLKSVKVANKYCYDYFKDKVADIAFYGANASADGRCLIVNGELQRFIGKGVTQYSISESVTSFGKEAFKDCSNLKSVKVANKYCYDYFKDKVADIAFYGANASADGRCLIVNGELQRFIGKGVTQYSIPESVTSIEEEAFEGCSDLKSVKVANKYCYDYFKDKVADIAFYGANASDDGRCLIIDGELNIFIAKGITEYTIPEGVTSVGDNAFRNYSSLTSITIPKSVTSIGYEIFSDCSNLTVINCMASTPPSISDLCIPSEVIIYVPKGAIKAYKKDENWMQYKKQIKLIK